MTTTSFKSGDSVSVLVFFGNDDRPRRARMHRLRGVVGQTTLDGQGLQIISKEGTYWVCSSQVLDPAAEKEKPEYDS